MAEQSNFKMTLRAWWRFYWRYAILFVLLLLVGGKVLNLLKNSIFDHQILFFSTMFYCFWANVIASFLVFKYVIGRNFRKSPLVLTIPAGTSGNPKWYKVLFIWFTFFWRFILFSVAIAFILGAVYPFVLNALGYDAMSYLDYSRYLGNFATLPASLLAFAILMWRKKEKRRKLVMQEFPTPLKTDDNVPNYV